MKTDVSEEHVTSVIRVKRISEIGTMLAVTAIRSSETSVLIRAIRRHIPEYGILHSNRSENLKSSILVGGLGIPRTLREEAK
jgi:hypothetical protein